ncbi:MAG: zinc finger domain-containing protein [Candidatus Pacearchaeota archaeon]|nr:zinc finger domain-containing protein [Candidatus Pacearchaeota archaeon]
MTKKQICTSCGKIVGGEGTVFRCPSCEKTISRCAFCKKLGIKYKCDCGFEGP